MALLADIWAFLESIEWNNATIVATVLGALIAGLFLCGATWKTGIFSLIVARMNRKSAASPPAAPQITNENTQSNVTNIRLDGTGFRAMLHEELAGVTFAPAQPVPDTGNVLKARAVECFNAGVDAVNQGQTGQGIGHYLDAVRLDPEYGFAHNNLGTALLARGDYDEAVEHLEEGVRLMPTQANIHANLVNALLRKGALKEALGRGTICVRLEPRCASGHYNLACVHAQIGDRAAAVAALATSIDLKADFRRVARTDTDFDAIRDDPEFRKLVDGV
ncbi:MAG: tetratricopeptide repeat protein [Planctomycetes bacterium]|nr:tetratricopeptide repeat protein [Planctomycetota bacterium]